MNAAPMSRYTKRALGYGYVTKNDEKKNPGTKGLRQYFTINLIAYLGFVSPQGVSIEFYANLINY